MKIPSEGSKAKISSDMKKGTTLKVNAATSSRAPINFELTDEPNKEKTPQKTPKGKKYVFDEQKDMTEAELVEDLKRKLSVVPEEVKLPEEWTKTCSMEEIKGFGCGGPLKCKYRTRLPKDVESRIHQMLANPGLQVLPEHQKAIDLMASKMKKRYNLLIIGAVSSNHYMEVQGMLHLVHKHLGESDIDYGVIIYDIGLSDMERRTMEEFCGCTVLAFPFKSFPEHVKTLRCYGWKPPIVQAHIRQAEFVIWADASIRMFNITQLKSVLETTRERGVQQLKGGRPMIEHTWPEMYHHFGDEPCAYRPYPMLHTTSGIYHNEPLIRQVVLPAWTACGLAAKCMCPLNPKAIGPCSGDGERFDRPYGQCHRFDQSAMSVILARLWQTSIRHVSVKDKGYGVHRGEKVTFFEYLLKSKWYNDTNEDNIVIRSKGNKLEENKELFENRPQV